MGVRVDEAGEKRFARKLDEESVAGIGPGGDAGDVAAVVDEEAFAFDEGAIEVEELGGVEGVHAASVGSGSSRRLPPSQISCTGLSPRV